MRLCLSLVLLLTASVVQAQSAGSTAKSPSAQTGTTGTSATAPVQDPQAVSILNQALSATGGAQVIGTVTDYTATGNITLSTNQQIQGTVTIQGLITGSEFRMDVVIPSGTRSWAVDQGIVSTKTENGKLLSFQPRVNVPSSDVFPYQTPLFPVSRIFPSQPLGSVIGDKTHGISNIGMTEVDGHSVQDVQIQEFPPPASLPSTALKPFRTRDLFIDTTTSQIIMMRDTLPKGLAQETHFSDYRVTSGILMPFAISQVIVGQQFSLLSAHQTWSIQLNNISFNSGLQESAFALQ